jgi:hypothetical protein
MAVRELLPLRQIFYAFISNVFGMKRIFPAFEVPGIKQISW